MNNWENSNQIFRLRETRNGHELFLSIITWDNGYEAAISCSKSEPLEVERFSTVFQAAQWLVNELKRETA